MPLRPRACMWATLITSTCAGRRSTHLASWTGHWRSATRSRCRCACCSVVRRYAQAAQGSVLTAAVHVRGMAAHRLYGRNKLAGFARTPRCYVHAWAVSLIFHRAPAGHHRHGAPARCRAVRRGPVRNVWLLPRTASSSLPFSKAPVHKQADDHRREQDRRVPMGKSE